MSVLVTGGGGFLGRALVDQLLEAGESVRVLNRSAHPDLETKGVGVIQADITDRQKVIDAGKGCQAVFHVAAKAGIWGKREEYFRINVEGTRNVLECCRQNGIGELVYTSTPSVIFSGKPICGEDEHLPYPGDFLCAYPETKAIAEREVIQAHQKGDVRALALRPHLLWGPGDPHLIPRIVERAMTGKLRQVGNGRNRVDITYIDNAAQAHLQAWQALRTRPEIVGGRPYFISQGESVNLWDWVETLLAGLSIPWQRRPVSFRLAYMAGSILEKIHTVFRPHKEPVMTRFVAHQLAQDHYYNHRAAEELLHYIPRVSIEEGLQRVWKEFRFAKEVL